MDSHDRPAANVRAAATVVTYALFGGGDHPTESDGALVAFGAASEAVRAAVEFVSFDAEHRFVAIVTGEFAVGEPKSASPRLEAVAGFAEPGQIVVSLATEEVARPSLGQGFGFRLLGSAHVRSRGEGATQVERLFFVEHPALPLLPRRVRKSSHEYRATAFFGRRRELEDLIEQIDLSRLVTVMGLTGVGKSSLIYRFVEDVGDRFPDGVGRIDLSHVAQHQLVAPTLLRVLDAPKLPGEDHLDAVVAHLARRRFLLVVDNVEHVLAEVARVVAAVLDACPEVAIVVGSLRPLRLPGEARFRVAGLESPVADADWRAMSDYDAVALFVDRAQLLDPKYRLTEKDADSVAGICRILGGNPLAIELAAARTSTFSPRQMLTRLDDRLFLLKDPAPNLPDRHRSLEAALDWATSHLSDDGNTLLRRLAVFSGGFSTDQAIEVCADAQVPEPAVIDAVEELVGSSMLVAMDSNLLEKRFRLDDSVGLYARRRLQNSAEHVAFEDRHREWCVHLCEEAAEGLLGGDQLLWLERLDAHMADIRALIERSCLAGGDGALAVRLLLAIHPYYFLRHFLMDGFRLASRVVDSRNCLNAPDLFRLQNLVSVLAGRLGDPYAAREYALRSVCTARSRGDRSGVARARASLGIFYEDRGPSTKSRRHFLYAASHFRRSGEELALVKALINLGGVEPWLGLLAEAEEHLAEAERLLARFPDATLRAYLHQNLGHVKIAQGRYEEALFHAREALIVFTEAQELNAMCTSLRNAAYAFAELGEPDLAARFSGANRKILHQLDQRVRPYEAAAFESLSNRLRIRLGDADYERNMFLGAESSIEELVTQAEQIIR